MECQPITNWTLRGSLIHIISPFHRGRYSVSHYKLSRGLVIYIPSREVTHEGRESTTVQLKQDMDGVSLGNPRPLEKTSSPQTSHAAKIRMISRPAYLRFEREWHTQSSKGCRFPAVSVKIVAFLIVKDRHRETLAGHHQAFQVPILQQPTELHLR